MQYLNYSILNNNEKKDNVMLTSHNVSLLGDMVSWRDAISH